LPGEIGNASGANRYTSLLNGRILVRRQPEANESISVFEERHCRIERTLGRDLLGAREATTGGLAALGFSLRPADLTGKELGFKAGLKRK
jgi:hypothetical protein